MEIKQKESFEVLSTKAAISLFKNDLNWSPLAVEYDTHPAYQNQRAASFSLKVKALFRFFKSFLVVLVKRTIDYELIPLHYRKSDTFKEKMAFLCFSLRNVFKSSSLTVKNSTYLAKEVYKKLDLQGVCTIKMANVSYQQLFDVSKLHFDSLRNRRGDSKSARKFTDSRSSVSQLEDPVLFNTINELLKQSGTLDAISSYLGRKAKLVDVNPQINDSSDDFWKKTFSDLDLPHPDTAYFHRDASGGDIKVIFYMSDVSAENGPFNYSIGSHKLVLSRIDDYICEANDSNGFASTHRDARNYFMALPRRLRQKGAFGNDLLNSSQISQEILESNFEVTASAGTFVVFDTKGIHRGGCVTNGERRVITCVVG